MNPFTPPHLIDHENTSFELPLAYFPNDYHPFAVEWKENAIYKHSRRVNRKDIVLRIPCAAFTL